MFGVQVSRKGAKYVNLKKRIEISHLRGSVVMFIHLFYSNTASYQYEYYLKEI